jgi:hypothetical protein
MYLSRSATTKVALCSERSGNHAGLLSRELPVTLGLPPWEADADGRSMNDSGNIRMIVVRGAVNGVEAESANAATAGAAAGEHRFVIGRISAIHKGPTRCASLAGHLAPGHDVVVTVRSCRAETEGPL